MEKNYARLSCLKGKKLEGHEEPIEVEEIDSEGVDICFNSLYVITTCVPVTEKPYLNTYIMDTEQMDQLFEDLQQCAEFVINIEPYKED